MQYQVLSLLHVSRIVNRTVMTEVTGFFVICIALTPCMSGSLRAAEIQAGIGAVTLLSSGGSSNQEKWRRSSRNKPGKAPDTDGVCIGMENFSASRPRNSLHSKKQHIMMCCTAYLTGLARFAEEMEGIRSQ